MSEQNLRARENCWRELISDVSSLTKSAELGDLLLSVFCGLCVSAFSLGATTSNCTTEYT